MLTVGPRSTWQPLFQVSKEGLRHAEIQHIPLARHSSASAFPTSAASSTSKEEPRPVDDGKQLDGTPLKTGDIRETDTDKIIVGTDNVFHEHHWGLRVRVRIFQMQSFVDHTIAHTNSRNACLRDGSSVPPALQSSSLQVCNG